MPGTPSSLFMQINRQVSLGTSKIPKEKLGGDDKGCVFTQLCKPRFLTKLNFSIGPQELWTLLEVPRITATEK